MKNKKNGIILLLVFVLVIVGASVLYTKLGENGASDRLMIYGETGNSKNESNVSDADEAEQQDGTDHTDEAEEQLTKALDFKVYDADGKEVHLTDYVGKPVVLNFWASWCGPCQSEMPAFQEKYTALGEDIQFLMVNMTGGRETLSSAKEFISETGYTFPVFYDTDSEAAIAYSVYSMPVTYFIDAQGYLVAQATGAITAEILQQGIDMIK